MEKLDFTVVSNKQLAELCRLYKGYSEAKEAKEELVKRKALAYAEMCLEPWKCVGKGFCPRDICCNE